MAKIIHENRNIAQLASTVMAACLYLLAIMQTVTFLEFTL